MWTSLWLSKEATCNVETWVRSLGCKYPLEEGKATHSSVLAWRIPGMGEPGGLPSMCCSMSSSNCCFLTCIQISQEAAQVVWSSHLFQNFPQFIVIHTVKGFGRVNKADIDVFLELSCFFHDPEDVGNLISGSSAFSMIHRMLVIWSGSSHFTYCWSLGWRILSITLLACEMSAIVW